MRLVREPGYDQTCPRPRSLAPGPGWQPGMLSSLLGGGDLCRAALPAPLGHGFPGKGAGAGVLSLRELLLAVGPAVLLCPCRDVALGALEVILDADPPPKGLSASLSVFQCCAGVPG